jgi:VIT1/CCC1 family predicted Fe2+/Mn2+ transporter
VAGERRQAALGHDVLGQDLAAIGHRQRFAKAANSIDAGRTPIPSEAASLAASPRGSTLPASDPHPMARRHLERHRTARIGWLRASVLGANDGIVSTASLVVGVAAAHATQGSILLTGVAGLVAGAMSMAAGEYVSVHSQADTEAADLAKERAELAHDPVAEHRELAAIYVRRGLDAALADEVADQLTAHDALGAHARDELGVSEALAAKPVQAALASAASFACGAALPLLVTSLAPSRSLVWWVAATALAFLALLGVVAARTGGADPLRGAWRVTFWGALAMAVTAGVGSLFGAVV